VSARESSDVQLPHRHRYGLLRVPEECQVAEPVPGRQTSHIASFSVRHGRQCRAPPLDDRHPEPYPGYVLRVGTRRRAGWVTPQRPRLGFRALIRKNQALAAKPSSRIQSSCCFPVGARPPGLLVPSPEELLVLYFSRRRKIRRSFGSDKRTSARRRERLSSPLAFRQ
jgi:hypothetical protein